MQFVFSRHDFDAIHGPVSSGELDKRAFDALFAPVAGHLGVYVFQEKEECGGGVLWVGQGGGQDSGRDITERIAQHFRVPEKLSGNTFCKNWLCRNGMSRTKTNRTRFLEQFPGWRMTTWTTDDRDAILLKEAVESMLTFLLRPRYAKALLGEDVAGHCTVAQLGDVRFQSTQDCFAGNVSISGDLSH